MKIFFKDALEVRVYDDRAAMGAEAAAIAGWRIHKLLKWKANVNIIFAAAPSQNEFLAALALRKIDWKRVNAFHMDEYVGLDAKAPQGFGNFLKERLFSKVSPGMVHYLNGRAMDLLEECQRYSSLLQTYPVDIVALGIGENTHLAFNDPHVARFDDDVLVKIVDLDEECRQQQVNDGCFATIGDVPTHALTLTVPALFAADQIYAIVPGVRKAEAVRHTLYGEIGPDHPSTILRRHPRAALFVDGDSASRIT